MVKNVFKLKQFEVAHGRSSMKVGVDAVLLGAWVGAVSGKIIEIGGGCGIISLMLAQRYPNSRIIAVDIDDASIEESKENFEKSPWAGRLEAKKMKFPEDFEGQEEKYDLIISNPPFYKSGVENPITRREKARHMSTLSPFTLLENGIKMLNPEGKLAMIFPNEFLEEIIEEGNKLGLCPIRICKVRNHERKKWKRVLVEFVKSLKEKTNSCEIEELTLYENNGKQRDPTQAYMELCRDFYLKF